MKRLTLLCLVGLLFASAPARADIFQWEYINPANPGLGKQQSTTLCVNGAGVDAVPGAHLLYRNLTMAYLIGTGLNRCVNLRNQLDQCGPERSHPHQCLLLHL